MPEPRPVGRSLRAIWERFFYRREPGRPQRSWGAREDRSGCHRMLTSDVCRDRAAECRQMAMASNIRVRDLLLDMARTWTRLAIEVEQNSRPLLSPHLANTWSVISSNSLQPHAAPQAPPGS